MSTPSREIEFKFAVPGEQSFRQLVDYLHLPESVLTHGVIQINHFFDSQTHCLRKKHIAIRLRQQGDNHILTIKGEQQAESARHSVLTDRAEQEVSLPGEAAQALLQGDIKPAQIIERHFDQESSAILQLIQSACGDQALVHIGEFRNVRIHVPPIDLPVGDQRETVEFELDTSTFPDGSIDHEIEIEISEHSDAEAMETALTDLLQHAGIEWHNAPSKAVRFYAALHDLE